MQVDNKEYIFINKAKEGQQWPPGTIKYVPFLIVIALEHVSLFQFFPFILVTLFNVILSVIFSTICYFFITKLTLNYIVFDTWNHLLLLGWSSSTKSWYTNVLNYPQTKL